MPMAQIISSSCFDYHVNREPRQITSSVSIIDAPQMSVDRATMSIQSQRMAPPTPLFSPVGATSTSSAASPYNGVSRVLIQAVFFIVWV